MVYSLKNIIYSVYISICMCYVSFNELLCFYEVVNFGLFLFFGYLILFNVIYM